MRNSEDYKRLLDEALEVAGPGDKHWNERFRSALERRELTLREETANGGRYGARDSYPDRFPYTAPVCFGEDGGWSHNTTVVWKEDA